jgi:long-chain acyl-CoA synthetase
MDEMGSDGMHRATDGVLLTGATGFLGMQLLARYLERTSRPVYALVRAPDQRQAEERMRRTLRLLFGPHHPYRERVTVLRGDITEPGLGLSVAPEWLAERVGEIVHGAASVSFTLELPTAREINVEGTRRVLQLARSCQQRGSLRRLSYVSTAFVCGDRRGQFSEDELDVGQDFRNTYEQSKFEAELLVQQTRAELPVTVLRPSIIVGERQTGWSTAFNVLYWPLRAFARGAYALLPARSGAPVDVVSVDYVADAILHLSQAREAQGATLHLVAGRQASSVGEIVKLTSAFFKRPAPRLLDPRVYGGVVHPLLLRLIDDERHRRALRSSEALFPYFAARNTFDDRRARVLLGPSGLSPAPLRGYFNRLVEFALAAEWGKREIPHPRSLHAGADGEWARATHPWHDEPARARPAQGARRPLVLAP